MKICPRCDDDGTDEPRDHSLPCRIRHCNSHDHSACEHTPENSNYNDRLMANMGA